MKTLFTLMILLTSSSFNSFAQGRIKSFPSFNCQLNGVEANGVIHTSDSILSVSCPDGNQYNIVTIEMNTPQKNLSTTGNAFSKDMKHYLSIVGKGQKIVLMLKVRDQNNGLRAIVATFQLE